MKNSLPKEMVKRILEKLDIGARDFGTYFGFRPSDINNFGAMNMSRSLRLERVCRALDVVDSQYPDIKGRKCLELFVNGRIVFDANDEEFGSTSLLSFTSTADLNANWNLIVKEAVESLLN